VLQRVVSARSSKIRHGFETISMNGVPAFAGANLSHPVMEGPVKRWARLSEKIWDDLLLHGRMTMAARGVGGVERQLIRLIFAGRNRMT